MIDFKSELASIIVDARNLNGALDDATQDLRMAIEVDAKARRTAKEARANYEALEAEFDAEAWAKDRSVPNGDGKATKPLADAIKAMVAAEKVQAQRQGVLAKPWAMLNAATYEAEDAAMALKQAETQFSGVKHAADLVGNILRVVRA